MDEPAFVGCKLKCRVIGIIEGEQSDGKEKERNDRVLAVEVANHGCARVKHIDDLGKRFCKELEAFFVNYHRLGGTSYKVLAAKDLPRLGGQSIRAAADRDGERLG
jgi:inorganic pyrophosphatase